MIATEGTIQYLEDVFAITVAKLEPSERVAWEALFRGYIAFYQREEPLEVYDRAWRGFQADDRVHALGARLDGKLVGITHFFVPQNTSGDPTSATYRISSPPKTPAAAASPAPSSQR